MDPVRESRIIHAAKERMDWVSVALEPLYHRHNASAILRTCDALGLQDIHLVGDEHFTPSRGPSKGVARWLDLHAHVTAHEAINAIKAEGRQLWVADFSEDPISPAEVPLATPICVWFGAELVGVAPEVREQADGVVTIPMRGLAQSLNVSVAAAMTLQSLSERARHLHGQKALLSQGRREDLLSFWLGREDRESTEEQARARALQALRA